MRMSGERVSTSGRWPRSARKAVAYGVLDGQGPNSRLFNGSDRLTSTRMVCLSLNHSGHFTPSAAS